MKLTRHYFPVTEVILDESCPSAYESGTLRVNVSELDHLIAPHLKYVNAVTVDLAKPGESCRIVHLLDTVQPMIKLNSSPAPDTLPIPAPAQINGRGACYAGFLDEPLTTGDGDTNLLTQFSVMSCAALPWEESSASSGLLYPRDAILDMQGPISGFTPFAKTFNLVLEFDLTEGCSSIEYDEEIRRITMAVADFLAKLTLEQEPESSETFSIKETKPDLPNVVLVWNCQSQGPYASTFLYGKAIDNLVPTYLNPNEMLDGAVVSGNYVWPAFKVPTWLHVNHPVVLDLYRRHGKELNFRGVIFARSHNPTTRLKLRCADFAVKLAKMLEADGLVMAWEGGGNAAVDGMLTIQQAERVGIHCSTLTFEFGGADGTEGVLLVDDVPEADAVVSGGSIEKHYTLPKLDRAVGGKTMRLNKESGGYFPPANDAIEFTTSTQFYLGGNQCGASTLSIAEY